MAASKAKKAFMLIVRVVSILLATVIGAGLFALIVWFGVQKLEFNSFPFSIASAFFTYLCICGWMQMRRSGCAGNCVTAIAMLLLLPYVCPAFAFFIAIRLCRLPGATDPQWFKLFERVKRE